MGRPSSYNEETAKEICDRIENGETIRQICADKDMPAWNTIRTWLQQYEAFQAQYARARENSAHASADLIQDLADKAKNGELEPNAARVAIDAHKWLAGKRKPKVYGDRQILDVGEDTLAKLSDERVHARIAELSKELGVAALLGGSGKKEAGE